MIKIDPNTRIIDLTVGELMELIESAQADKAAPQAPTAPKNGMSMVSPGLPKCSIAV